MNVSYVDATAGAVEHCEVMATEFPDLASRYEAIGHACREKLWHQLTLQVLEFVQDPSAARMTGEGVHTYLVLYEKVVLAVESKLNPLSLAVIASHVSNALAVNDVKAAKAVLENLLAKQKDQNQQQVVYLQSKHSLLVLKHAATEQELQALAKVIKTNAEKLVKEDYDDHRVHAAHYETCLQYYKRVGPPEAFYSSALLFLQYSPPPPASTSSTTTTFWQDLGVDLCLAALTGEGVYDNLGHVHDICANVLIPEVHPQRWLVELLHATADGNVSLFQQLSQQYSAQIQAQPALVALQDKVREKLTLLALVHLVFDKSSHQRDIPFQEIAERLQIPLEQVEWVVMRACSVNIMEGSIDQVSQQVHVNWILPRVLNQEQMKALSVRYGDWANQVGSTKDYMMNQEEQQPTTTTAA